MDDETKAIIRLSATGLGTAEVADALGLSREAVRARLYTAMRETGARSKLELVRQMLKSGAITA